MVSGSTVTIRHSGGRFSYDDADGIAHRALTGAGGRNVLIDLEKTTDTSTAALARLVALRGRLLKVGSDLRVQGLHGRARDVYEICLLGELLPQR